MPIKTPNAIVCREISKRLHYDPSTGRLVWMAPHTCRSYNCPALVYLTKVENNPMNHTRQAGAGLHFSLSELLSRRLSFVMARSRRRRDARKKTAGSEKAVDADRRIVDREGVLFDLADGHWD